jgi:uncharacterized protein YdhG (YjbR/CyaY superfamily)
MKIAKIVVVRVIGSVEDECVFKTFNFVKSKFRNQLTKHVTYVMHMFTQNFNILLTFFILDVFKV